MKSNNQNKIFSNAKYFLFVPIIILMLAVIVFVLFSYNKSYDFKEKYSFTVSYKQNISDEKYSDAVNLIENNLYDKFGGDVDITTDKINEDIVIGTIVNVYLNDNIDEIETKLNDLCEEIKVEVNLLLNNGHAIVSDTQHLSGLNYSKDLLWSGVALLITMAVAFAYFWFRFEIKTAITSLVIVPFVSLMMSAFAVLFRLPVSTLFSTSIVISTLIAYVMYMLLSEKLRECLRDDKYESYTNTQLISVSLSDTRKSITLMLLGVTILYLTTMLFFTMKMFVFAILGIIGLIIATYVSTIITSLLWTKLYRRDKDNRLKELKDNEAKMKKEGKKKKTKEDKEKILV